MRLGRRRAWISRKYGDSREVFSWFCSHESKLQEPFRLPLTFRVSPSFPEFPSPSFRDVESPAVSPIYLQFSGLRQFLFFVRVFLDNRLPL
jgi:hypothetical protein